LERVENRSQDHAKDYIDGVFVESYDTNRDTLSWQNDIAIGTNQLFTLGADRLKDSVDSTTAYTVSTRTDDGLYAQYQGAFNAHDLQLSLRRDDNEQFGQHNTGGIAWGYGIMNGLRLTASYGTAFKAPTFNDLYYPGFSNPMLKPETSRTVEVGVSGKQAAGRWSVHVYQTDIEDLIAYNSSIFLPDNLQSSRIQGIEAICATSLLGWQVNTDLTLIKPENRTAGAHDGNTLPRRAEQALRIAADRDINRYSLGATLFAEGRRYDDLANTAKLGGYGTVDLRVGYAINKAWQLQARIANLFDKEYQTADHYNQQGRSFFITLRR